MPGRAPFAILARALAEGILRREPSAELRAGLAARNLDWLAVVAQASDQYVLAALAGAVRRLDVDRLLEPELGGFLAAVHAGNAARNVALRDQLEELVASLNGVGIEPVLLKGALRLVDGLYPDPGWRMLRDLDLLVPTARLAEAIQAARDVGYAPNPQAIAANPRAFDHHHYPQLWHEARPAPVDMHGELFVARRRRLLSASDVLAAAQPVELDGIRVRVPAPGHQLVHLIGHAQIDNRGHVFGRIELRDRLEAALLIRRLPAGVDWIGPLLGHFDAAGHRRALLTFLLSLRDGDLCDLPALGRIDLLTRLQHRRVVLQARSSLVAGASDRLIWRIDRLARHVASRETLPPLGSP